MRDLFQRPATVDGGHGRVPASQVDTTAKVPAPRPMSEKEANRLMLAELLQATRALNDTSTRLADQLGGRQGTLNGVLEYSLIVFDASGLKVWDFPVVVGSVQITNHSAAAKVTFASGDGTGEGAPISGRGRHIIEPGATVSIPVGTRAFTLWGTAADSVSVQVFTGLQAYGITS